MKIRNGIHLTAIFSTLILSGCITSYTIQKDNLLPRYVSPLFYTDYSCKQMRNTYQEFLYAERYYVKLKKPDANMVYNYQQKNEISYNDTVFTQKGLSVLQGHREALKQAAADSECALSYTK